MCGPLDPSPVMIYHFLSLLKTVVPAWLKHYPWMHILNTSAAFCSVTELRRTGKIRSFLSTDAANKLVASLILSRLDHYNSPVAGPTDNKLNKLQRMQSHAT